ncbi:unnamed protein product [Soboliphyme baturini]|uniref:N-terminal methionine N(alpha)-acetyltransferase NatC n=1 Tax=Soboliphyme baturini TaxID=241478 RepID=A0A183ITI5_9BILA|nr:unnamed protein product [Soboliphyme baturini]
MNIDAAADKGEINSVLKLKKKQPSTVDDVCNGEVRWSAPCSSSLNCANDHSVNVKDTFHGRSVNDSSYQRPQLDEFDKERVTSPCIDNWNSTNLFNGLIAKLENCKLYAVAESKGRTAAQTGGDAGTGAYDRLTDDTVGSEITNKVAEIVPYQDESQMPFIMKLITKDLSEPYSIYTYRYFIHNWPSLCFLARAHDGTYVGAIVCKLALHPKGTRRGYIAMLAVDQAYRRCGIASELVIKAITTMMQQECDEVVLEAEVTNHAALNLYENLGFIRYKRLLRYYLNGVDAFRLKLWLKSARSVYL